MADNSEDFKFNLDVRDSLAGLDKVKDTIVSLGDSKNLSGLIQGFTRLAGPIALAGTALFAFKAAIDMSVEGEQIIRIEENFKNFSNQVGVSNDEMIHGIEKSTQGMVDLEDAMASAGKVMIDFGSDARRIPELFDVATKASLVYGGSVTDNFEKISLAITGGNTRMLKSIGLKVDAANAEAKYAISLGKTVDTLTEQEKKQALLNAVLAKGNESFKTVDASVTPLTVSIKKLGITMHDIGENIAKSLAQTIGGPLSKAFDYFNEKLKGLVPKAPMDEAKERVETLKNKILEAQEILDKRAEAKGFIESVKAFWSTAGPMTEKIKYDLAAYNIELKKAEENLESLQKKQSEAGPKGTTKKPEKSQEEIAAEKAQYSQFQKDLILIKQQRLQSEMNIETDASKYKQQLNDQIVLFEEQTQNKIAQISANAGLGKTYTHAQAAQIIEQIEADKTAKIKALQDDLENNQMKVFDNQLKNAKTASEGMVAAFAQGAAQAKKESKDFGAQGVQTFNSVKNNAVSAFKAMGDGSKSAGDAIKGFLLNSVADYVEMKGQAMLLEGMWPPNPLAIAAGGGLIALSAAMRSAAGGGGGSSSGGAVSGGGASAGPMSSPAPVEQQKKSVTVQVQGNYFETEQTKTRLLEMMREASDATDFKYQQIGVS